MNISVGSFVIASIVGGAISDGTYTAPDPIGIFHIDVDVYGQSKAFLVPEVVVGVAP
jgi:hypothetical protein